MGFVHDVVLQPGSEPESALPRGWLLRRVSMQHTVVQVLLHRRNIRYDCCSSGGRTDWRRPRSTRASGRPGGNVKRLGGASRIIPPGLSLFPERLKYANLLY